MGRHFTLRDVTDLEPVSESHQHDLWFDLSEPEHPVRSETYTNNGGIGAQEWLRLVSAAANQLALTAISKRAIDPIAAVVGQRGAP